MASDAPQSGRSRSNTSQRDRRVSSLADQIEQTDRVGQMSRAFAADPNQVMNLEAQQFRNTGQIHYGHVVYSLPYCNWYKVQMAGGLGVIGCTAIADGSLRPIGVRSAGVIPPNSPVLVWKAPGDLTGIILGPIPMLQTSGAVTCPDRLVQGGGSGIQREKLYTEPFRTLYRNGGIKDFAANRPLDSTTLEWGRFAETGVGIMIDPFQAYLRVNEMCGLFLNYFDSYAKLVGINLDLASAVHEFAAREDEGENRLASGYSLYPWEAQGLFAPVTPEQAAQMMTEYDDREVQYRLHRAKIDVPEEATDIQSVNRYQEFGGYLGQGHRRLLMVPGRTSGFNRFGDDAKTQPDYGVWEESIGVDGTYVMRSARQVIIGKRVLIPVPHEKKLPEDPTGDSMTADNYRFSGQFGGTDTAEHKIGDPILPAGENRHLLQVSAIFDILAYNYNWRPLHPFHYHTEDYVVPEESEMAAAGKFTRSQDILNFGELSGRMYMSYPSPKTLRVDHRHGDIEYFQREAYLAMLPDGSVALGDGYGAQITLAGGSIRFDCPGDLHLTPGRNLVALGGDDIVMRAHNSFDATAGNKDLRLKAERNMQLLSGNSGVGGTLIESKGAGEIQDYENKIGEEVISNGVVLRAANGLIAQWGQTLYHRSLNSGQIMLDADKGRGQLIQKAATETHYLASSALFAMGPVDEECDTVATHALTTGGVLLDKGLTVNGFGQFDGAGLFTSHVNALQFGEAIGSPFVGEIERAVLLEQKAEIDEAFNDLDNSLEASCEAVKTRFYEEKRPGNDKVIQQAQFSYRDDPQQAQYNTQQFQLVESRWHTMARTGLGSGGSPWTEPPVVYQNREQLPWPGNKKWKLENTLLTFDELRLYDPVTGTARDRSTGVYDDPELDTLDPISPAAGYLVI